MQWGFPKIVINLSNIYSEIPYKIYSKCSAASIVSSCFAIQYHCRLTPVSESGGSIRHFLIQLPLVKTYNFFQRFSDLHGIWVLVDAIPHCQNKSCFIYQLPQLLKNPLWIPAYLHKHRYFFWSASLSKNLYGTSTSNLYKSIISYACYFPPTVISIQ